MSASELEPWDESHMRRALKLALRGWGQTHPNPLVGAVLAEGQTVLSEGWHARAGEAHAEVMALRDMADPVPEGATLYVTLEPCSTHGRTPPCVDLIRKKQVKRVVVGTTDPNPEHAGRGLEILREAGLSVVTDVLEEECRDLNLIFNHWITTGRPLIAGKVAVTLDGKIAAHSGRSKWITGEAARADVMRWRRLFPAIAVGAGTVLADDPSLTARLSGHEPWCPKRLVFDEHGLTMSKPSLKLYSDNNHEQTVVINSRGEAPESVRCWQIERDDFLALDEHLIREGCYGVFVEGGQKLLSSLLAAQRLDYLFVYQAPMLMADASAPGCFSGCSPDSPDEAIRLDEVTHAVVGQDILTRGHVVYPE